MEGADTETSAMPRDHKVSTRPLLDKLGLKPDARVALVGGFPEWFRVLVLQRASAIVDRPPQDPVDLIFLAADSHADLAVLPRLREGIVANGAIWVVSRKGKQAALRDVEVIQAALDAGLVDNKVASFSETHTSLRLVIRLRDRPA
jgi:hypothetical protein